ncbi:SRPBCC family protein [Prescottella agglutinans]|uniref:SRPBCC family protein n=1 Tax=Prescottella agglutinans TaxID=1644129 RepID=UPI003D9945DC
MSTTQEEKTPTGGADLLKDSLKHLVGAVTEKGVKSLTDTVASTVGHLDEFTEGGGHGGLATAVTGLAQGESPAKVAMKAGWSGVTGKLKEKGRDLKEALTGGKGKGKGKGRKFVNIVEQIDIGAPLDLVYDQWTQFTDFPGFMKKLEQVEQVSDEKLQWKAQVFWSHRSWESTILEQVPDERIVWRSKGAKGYLDGAVTFHELTPGLTRVLVIIEYHPQGFFEKTGNIWRAQGRRIRLELKHFQRHVMLQTVLHPDDVEGWHGEIHDSRVVPPEELEEQDEQEELEEPDDEQEEQDQFEEPEEEDEEGPEEEERDRDRGNAEDESPDDERASDDEDDEHEAAPRSRRRREQEANR